MTSVKKDMTDISAVFTNQDISVSLVSAEACVKAHLVCSICNAGVSLPWPARWVRCFHTTVKLPVRLGDDDSCHCQISLHPARDRGTPGQQEGFWAPPECFLGFITDNYLKNTTQIPENNICKIFLKYLQKNMINTTQILAEHIWTCFWNSLENINLWNAHRRCPELPWPFKLIKVWEVCQECCFPCSQLCRNARILHLLVPY